MGILDGIVEWFAEQVMKFLDSINSSVLGALGCNMSTFKRYFPAAETMYKVFVALGIGLILLNGTPYKWILKSELPPLNFENFNSVLLIILGVCCNGAVTVIGLVILLILAWNYIKLLFEAAERYVLLGVLVFTAPVAFAMGASKATGNIFAAWCRMLGGQVFLLIMNAWCLRVFTSMVGAFLANPLAV